MATLNAIPALKTGQTYLKMRFSRNQVVHSMEALAAADRSVLRYQLNVYMPDEYLSETFALVQPLEASERPPIVINGTSNLQAAYFFLEDTLDRNLRWNRPDFGQAIITECPLTTSPFKLTEKRLPANTTEDQPVEYVLKGGLSFEDFPHWGEHFFDQYLADNRPFLTWQPADKLVDKGQQEFLYFLVNFTPLPTTLKVWVKVKFADGSTIITDRLAKETPKQYQVYRIPAGFTALDLASIDPTQTVVSWSVFLTDENNDRLSEIRTYYLDQQYRRNAQYFIFNNSLGGFDTVRFTGSYTETLATTKELIEKYLAENYEPQAGESAVSNLEGEKSLNVFTGYFKADYKDYLQELFLAREVYLVGASALISVRLDTKELMHKAPDDPMLGYKLKFIQNHVVRTFSRLPVYVPPVVVYYSLEISEVVQRNNCPSGQIGSQETITLAAGAYTSTDSQQDAQAQAQAWFDANKQALANAQGTCTLPVYNNTLQSQQFTTQCSSGVGSVETIYVQPNTFQSNVSVADANNQAIAWLAANGQAQANAQGTCITIHATGEQRNYNASYPDQNGSADITYEYWVVFKNAAGESLAVAGNLHVNIRDYGSDSGVSFDNVNSVAIPNGVTEYKVGDGFQHVSYNSDGSLNYDNREDFFLQSGTGYVVG